MADQTVEIKLVLRDELSRQLQPLIAQVRQLSNAVDTTRPQQHMERFGGAVQGVRRELSALSQITFGGLIGGGVVAGLMATSKALGDMANRGLQLRYSADALGVSTGMLNKFSDAMMGLGKSREAGQGSIEAATKSLRELQIEGGQSKLFQELERAGGESGRKIAQEMAKEMAGPRGVQGGIEHALRRMAGMNQSGAAKFGEMLFGPGFGREAARDLLKMLDTLPRRYELSQQKLLELAHANAALGISWDNIKLQLASSLLPMFAQLSTTLSEFLQSAAGKEFTKQLETWGQDMNVALKEWLEGGGLQKLINEITKAVGVMGAGFRGADEVITAMGTSWGSVLGGLALASVAINLAGIAGTLATIAKIPGVVALLALLGGSWALLTGPSIEDIKDPEKRARAQKDIDRGAAKPGDPWAIWNILKDLFKGNIDLMGKGGGAQPQSLLDEGQPKTPSERRADAAEKKQASQRLTDEFKTLAYDMDKLNAYLMAGGPEGGKGASGFRPSNTGQGEAPPGYGPYSPVPWVEGGPQASVRYNNPGAAYPQLGGGHMAYGSTGYGILNDPAGKKYIANFPNPVLGAAYNFDVFKQRFLNKPLSRAMGDWSGGSRAGTTGYDPSTKVSEGMINNPDWAVPFMMATAGDEAAKLGIDEAQMRQAHRVFSAGGLEPYSTAAINQQVPFDTAGSAPIESMLAGRDSAMNGSATVNIDVGGLSSPARNPADLFKQQPLGGAVQMQNVTRPPNDPLSFQ